MRSLRGSTLPILLAATLTGLAPAVAASAQAPAGAGGDSRGDNVEGNIGSRDNTRAYGTVYDPAGKVLGKVDVWVMNDNAPAARMRLKSRPTGSYQVRNVGRLYNQDDIYGIVLRLRFEAPGYRTAEYIVPVERNEIVWLHPVMWPEDQEPSDDVRRVMVMGRLRNAKGKKIKDGSIVVTSPHDASLRVEVAAAKDGSFEALLWNAPSRITVQASAGAVTGEKKLDVSAATRHDLVTIVASNITL
ncbi:MAG: carboxypeptidase-like regulatory domain-containing protein [Acidobacteriota bacterium]|nr:carboxypeptidase-like regulatory domain-containing protein [Acidobacteriota bacterium]